MLTFINLIGLLWLVLQLYWPVLDRRVQINGIAIPWRIFLYWIPLTKRMKNRNTAHWNQNYQNTAWKKAEYPNTVNPNVPRYIWSIREQTMKNCCLFVFYNNINSFWQPFPLKFLGKLNVQESEKQTSPPSHHFYGLYSYRPWLSTNQRARNHSVIVKQDMLTLYCANNSCWENNLTPSIWWNTG